MHQIVCRLGLCPRPTGGAYLAPLHTGLGVGPTGNGKEGGEGKRRGGEGGEEGEGVPECPNPKLASLNTACVRASDCRVPVCSKLEPGRQLRAVGSDPGSALDTTQHSSVRWRPEPRHDIRQQRWRSECRHPGRLAACRQSVFWLSVFLF